MPLILQFATKEHALQRAEVQLASFHDDPVMNSLMPSVSREERLNFFGTLFLQDIEKPGVKNLEIVDTETGKVVAFAQWKYPKPKDSQQKVESEDVTLPDLPDGANLRVIQGVFELYGELGKKYYDPEKMYYLNYMHVTPEYQRRGLGRRLMEQALLDADKDGAKSFLCASAAGRRLYVKYCFYDVEVRSVDLIQLGAIGARNTTAMIRDPQPVRM